MHCTDTAKSLTQIFIESIENIIEPMLKKGGVEIIEKGVINDSKDYFMTIDTENQEYLSCRIVQESVMPRVTRGCILGEEGFENNQQANMAILKNGLSVILDPLDGSNTTVRFLRKELDRNKLYYGVQGAFLQDGEPICGSIVTVHAQNVEYACATINGDGAVLGGGTMDTDGKITIEWEKPLVFGRINPVIISSYDAFNPNYRRLIDANHAAGRFQHDPFTPHSAAHQAMQFLKGNAKSFIHRQFRLWDHMPAMAIAIAAGAKAYTLNGDHPVLSHHRKDGFILAHSYDDFVKSRKAFLGNIVYDPANTGNIRHRNIRFTI